MSRFGIGQCNYADHDYPSVDVRQEFWYCRLLAFALCLLRTLLSPGYVFGLCVDVVNVRS